MTDSDYLDGLRDVAAYRHAHERLRTRALSPAETARTHWRKSSYSGTSGTCVEVAELTGGHRGVRDSKDPAGPALTFTPDAWTAFTADVRSGAFD